MSKDTELIRRFLAEAAKSGDRRLVANASEHFGVSRQMVHRYLAGMVKEGVLTTQGKTKGRVYTLHTVTDYDGRFEITTSPREDVIWRDLSSRMPKIPANVRDICCYGFTEMFNNALEHSGGAKVAAVLRHDYLTVSLWVKDDGIGIYKKIKDGLDLRDERESILELVKGKLTTEPKTHTGQGIFFTSRVFDSFSLIGNGLAFQHLVGDEDDWLIQTTRSRPEGTLVAMDISTRSQRTVKEVMDRYATSDVEPGFTKTHVPVRLLPIGQENLVSRSEAKRLLLRFEEFGEVMLDFKGISQIGQAFADEIFRVFHNEHPEIEIVPLNANKDVATMIHSAQAEAAR